MPRPRRKRFLAHSFNLDLSHEEPVIPYVRSLEDMGLSKVEISPDERSEFQKAFGENIQQLRKVRRMNQREMALFLGISVDSVSALERGKIFVSGESILKLARAFDCHVQELFLFPMNRHATPKHVGLMKLIKDAPPDVQIHLERQIRLTLSTISEVKEMAKN
jgi:transcriptional regulator with XRE-family HTH domain